jgi:hypothetical protein
MMNTARLTLAILVMLVAAGCATRQPTATAKLAMLGFTPAKIGSVDAYIRSESFTQDVFESAGIADADDASISAKLSESHASRSMMLNAKARSHEDTFALIQAIVDTLDAKYSPGRHGLYPKFDMIQKPTLR